MGYYRVWIVQEIQGREQRDVQSHHPVVIWAGSPLEARHLYALDYSVAVDAVRCTEIDAPEEG